MRGPRIYSGGGSVPVVYRVQINARKTKRPTGRLLRDRIPLMTPVISFNRHRKTDMADALPTIHRCSLSKMMQDLKIVEASE